MLRYLLAFEDTFNISLNFQFIVTMSEPKKSGSIGKTAKEYSQSTTIHGFAYIGEDGLLILERLLWIFIVCLGIFLSIYMSVSAYVEWKGNPVLTTVATTGFPIEKVEFPAITICAQVSHVICFLLVYHIRITSREWQEKLWMQR